MDIEGIVLRIVPYKEKDAMVTILSKDGFVSFLARGILKIDSKNAHLIGLYNKAIFELSEAKNGHISLKSGKILHSSGMITKNLNNLLALDAIGEIILRMCDENSAKKLYDYLDSVIKNLNDDKVSSLTSCLIIGARTLIENGYMMKVDGCVECGSKNKLVSFDFNSGGYICVKHFNPLIHHNQNESYLKAIRLIFLAPFDKINLVNISLTDEILILNKMKEFILEQCGVTWNGIETLLKLIKN